MNNVYKFVKWDVPQLEELKNSIPYIIMNKLNNSEKLTREEKDKTNLFEDNGEIRLQGWVFNFRVYCKRFFVKFKYDYILEIYAFDKTQIRNHYKNQILEIVEI